MSRPHFTCLCASRDVCPVHDEEPPERDPEWEQRLLDEAAEDHARRDEED